MSIISYIRRFFKRKTTPMAKKYDIIIHDEDMSVHPEKQTGLIAESPAMLRAMFEQCGQHIEIVREYEDDESKNFGVSARLGTQTNNTKETKEIKENPPPQISQASDNTIANTSTPVNVEVANPTPRPDISSFIKKPEPPRFFEVGGIKCKIDNGKMYQKQWMRLSDKESQDIRIVSDTNNKICPIKDKHIEVMKWVLIQDEEDENSSTPSEESGEKQLELING